MKKLLSLGLLLALALTASADEVRKLWDFRKGFSETTLANLAADASSTSATWTNYASKGNYESKARSEEGELTCNVNGESWVIPETEGLKFHGKSAKHINIQFQEEKLGPHIWLNGKKAEDAVTIPQIPAGEKVTVIYSSHKDTEKRGFKVVTSGFADANEKTQWTSTGIDTFVVYNNNAETTDLKIQTTNGAHIHYICVGEAPEEEESITSIAYLYDSQAEGYSAEADAARDIVNTWAELKYNSQYKLTAIDISGDVSLLTRDSLASYNLVALSGFLKGDNAYISTIKEAIAFVPMLNTSSALYEAWGYSNAKESQTNLLTAGEKAAKSTLFNVFNPDGGSTESWLDENNQFTLLAEGNNITGYEAPEGSYFAEDSVWAKAGDVNAIHMHNAKRNAYILLPLGTASSTWGDGAADLIVNAANTIIGTKSGLTNAPKASYLETYHHLYTTVTLKHSIKGSVIYYTTDGSDPTTESTVYTEPFDINQKDAVVKTLSISDGYLPSEIGENTVKIYELAKQPTISVEQENGKSIVTITPAEDGDNIVYNYTGSNQAARSTAYEGPITLTKHATITAFTLESDEKGTLQSEIVSEDVAVNGEKVRLDVVSHFDANKADWSIDGANPSYYVGKNGYAFYTDEIIKSETFKDSEGNDSIVNTYKETDSLTVVNPANGWEVKTYGQVVSWESNTIGHDVGSADAYNPATAYDDGEELTSNYHITFGKTTGNSDGVQGKPNAFIQTTEAIQAPFDIVAIFGGKGSKMEVSVTTDTLSGEWVRVDTIYSPNLTSDSKGRTFARNIVAYEGSDKVFVKLAALNTSGRLFNVIIKNAGEKSQEYTGIVEIDSEAASGQPVSTTVYSLNGARLNRAAKGVNIVKETFANGTVKTRKVIVK